LPRSVSLHRGIAKHAGHGEQQERRAGGEAQERDNPSEVPGESTGREEEQARNQQKAGRARLKAGMAG
jgi:hypothetical protein